MKKKKIERPVTILEKKAANLLRNEYLLILSPEQNFQEQIMQEKKTFYGKYKAVTALSSKPHITLVSFLQYQPMEEKIIHRLSNIAGAQLPFVMAIDGFGSFPSHTIFFRVTTPTAIQELVKQIRPIQHLLKSKEDKPHLIMEPHLTLARQLTPRQYEQGWLEYRHKHFTGKCLIKNMLLLKKKDGERYYESVMEFAFTNKVEKITQGTLF